MKLTKILLILSITIITGISLYAKKASPEETLSELSNAAKKADWGQVYDCFSKDSQKGLETMMKSFITMAASIAKNNPDAVKNNPQFAQILELEKLTGKDFFIKLMQVNPDSKKILGDVEAYQITNKEVVDQKVVLTVKVKDKQEKIPFINENNEWKIDLSDQLKLSAGKKSNQEKQEQKSEE